MDQIRNNKPFKKIFFFGLFYLTVGIISALVTNPLEPGGMQTALRLLALAIAITAFVVHIRMEIIQSNTSALKSALNASLAAALGTFLLAVLANIYALPKAAENKNQLPLALVVWPAVTGLLAFLGGYVFAKILSRTRSKRK